MTNAPSAGTTRDTALIASTQRRMLLGFVAAIVIVTIVQIAYPLLRHLVGEDPTSQYSMRQMTVAVGMVEFVGLLAFVVPAFGLIRAIGWSRMNQVVFVVICLASAGCGPLLVVALLLINREANRLLRADGLVPGVLGVPTDAIARFESDQDS